MTNNRFQTEAMFVLDAIVEKKHPYLAYDRVVDFHALAKPLHARHSDQGRREIGAERGLRMLILQFVEDRSDREMERFMRDDMAARRFCGFAVNESAPDRSCSGALRKRLGTDGLMKIFYVMRAAMIEAKLNRKILAFVDASKLESKPRSGRARPRSRGGPRELRQRYSAGGDPGRGRPPRLEGTGQELPRLQAARRGRYAVRPDSRVAATSGEVTDAAGPAYVCPSGGLVYADKGYRGRDAIETLVANGCRDAAIKRDNMKIKNRDKDGRISRIRSPYERVFSKTPNRMRCPALDKAQFQIGAFAIDCNLKRLVALGVEPIPIA